MIANFPKLHEDVDDAHETAAGESLFGRCLTHEIVVQESTRNGMKFLQIMIISTKILRLDTAFDKV